MFHAIVNRTAIGLLTALQRTGNTNKFRFQGIACDPNRGIAVAAHIDERKMG